MRTGEGYLLVFALDDERSFDKVCDNFWEQIVRMKVRKLSLYIPRLRFINFYLIVVNIVHYGSTGCGVFTLYMYPHEFSNYVLCI